MWLLVATEQLIDDGTVLALLFFMQIRPARDLAMLFAMAASACAVGVRDDATLELFTAYDDTTTTAASGSGGAAVSSSASMLPAATGGAAASGGADQTGGGGAQPMEKCGDGKVGGSEECDDGNAVDGDGCSSCVVDCDTQDHKHPVTNHCYHLVNLKAHWKAAESDCNVWGGAPGLGHLVSIQDKQEQDFVQNLGSGYERWIGATDVMVEKQYEWIDGNVFVFDNWRKGEPNNNGINGGEEDCAEIEADGQWDDQPCEKTKRYICERSAAGVPAATSNGVVTCTFDTK